MRSRTTIGLLLIVISLPLTAFARIQDRPRAVLQRQPVDATAQPAVASTPFTSLQPAPDATHVLAAARSIYVFSKSGSYDASELESKLINRSDFAKLGLIITRDPDNADLVLEVSEGDSSVTLIYTAVDARTRTVIAAGKATSIFGGATRMIARDFVGKIQRARKST